MNMSDLASVTEIIDQHDDDDGQEAAQEFSEQGIEDHFVCVEQSSDAVLGVTGYRIIEGCDRSAWLSWTYVRADARGKGYGKQLVEHVIERLKEQRQRLLLVKVSDYQDPQDGPIYAAALALYQHLGFQQQLQALDFYADGESQTILSMHLSSDQDDDIQVADEKPIIRFNGLYEIAETDGAYSFSWTVEESAGWFAKRGFSSEDLKIGLDAAIDQGARRVFLTFPSNLVLIHRPLQSVGFKFIGQLPHYYEQGLHELHFVHDLQQFH